MPPPPSSLTPCQAGPAPIIATRGFGSATASPSVPPTSSPRSNLPQLLMESAQNSDSIPPSSPELDSGPSQRARPTQEPVEIGYGCHTRNSVVGFGGLKGVSMSETETPTTQLCTNACGLQRLLEGAVLGLPRFLEFAAI